MDQKFKEMLEEAQIIRITSGNVGMHAEKMAAIIQYGSRNGLLAGNVFSGTASEESLALAAEQAGFIVQVIHKKQFVGSVLNMSSDQKLKIIKMAKDLSERDLS